MNNAGHSDRDIILVVNDNGMSISPNVGAINKLLGSIVADPRTNRMREAVKKLTVKMSHVFGPGVVDFARNVEESRSRTSSRPACSSRRWASATSARSTGTTSTSSARRSAFVRGLTGPRVVHIITEKGKGFTHAEENKEKWHGLAAYDPDTGEPRKKASGPPTWTQVFGDAITGLAKERDDFVVITAAMPSGTGTNIFQKAWPERFFDIGIAEGHAVTFAGGLATQGVRPICAIYSTFLQRGYDNIIHDVAVQQLPVIFAMDRAGLVGEDGQTHMGLYDIAYMLAVPGMTVTAPRDGDELIGLLRTALDHRGGPVLHPLSARQGAARPEAGGPGEARCRTAPGSCSGPAVRSRSSRWAPWWSRPSRPPRSSPPRGSAPRW